MTRYLFILFLACPLYASQIVNPGGSPGGSSNQVQYNSGGNFAGSNNFQFNGSSVTLGGNIGFTDTSTYGVVGSTTNNSAATGNVGEYVSSFAAFANIAASPQWGDLTSISLTAGDWDIFVHAQYANNGAGSPLFFDAGASVTSGNSGTGLTLGDTYVELGLNDIPTGSNVMFVTLSPLRFSLSSTTTVYLKVRGSYSSGTPQAAGRISARRAR